MALSRDRSPFVPFVMMACCPLIMYTLNHYIWLVIHTRSRARAHTHTHTHTTLNLQVSTDVTAGCYARSRLSNNSDIHWATIKAKKRRHAMFKVDDDFGFKVMQCFQKSKSGTLSDVHVYLSLSYGVSLIVRVKKVIMF
jgi:hypothetical protein